MRARARWGIAPLLAAPAGAWALGLGDIELKSALNQPFSADIVLSATTEELQSLKIALAGADTFERYGLDRPAFLSNFDFRVVPDRAGRHVIQVTSRESVAEPFLTLLVEATWPRGRTLREYTVLLDPPVLLPGPATSPAVQPAETRTSSGAGGPIDRPAPRTSAPAPAPEPAAPAPPVSSAVTEPAPGPVSNATPTAPRAPAVAPGATYGPVQRGDTLWAISDRNRPDGVSINQMMVAIYEANAAAFGGNINFLRAGATLRIPERADLEALTRTAANAEVQRQTDEWQNRSPGGQLRLLPPTDTAVARNTEPAPAPAPRDTSPPPAADAGAEAAAAAAAAEAEESRRLLELRNEELRNLQEQAAAVDEPAEAAPDGAEPAPGVDLEVFADEETEAAAPVEEQPDAVPVPAPVPTPAVATEPSLVSQALGWVRSPFFLIGLGVAALLLTALWFVRRRRHETEDVTGRWEALQAETDEDTRDATERMRRQLSEETIVVEEQHAQALRPSPEPEPPARRAAAPAAPARGQRPGPSPDETLSSQTVINLDQADAIAEADFHVAYGLYDQAAELVQKAIETAPERRDLKVKLLEVFFMWGNKDAFLKSAQSLRGEIGQAEDADWDKVVIMGRQICPDERLFTEATTGGGRVDVDLQAGDSPLDLAFDEAAAADVGAAAGGLDFQLEGSDERPAPKPAAKPAKAAKSARDRSDEMLDIGSKTAAGLEAALFAPMGDDDDTGARTSPDIPDALAVTQESPTIERPGRSDWATAESPTLHSAEAPTVETPTIESPAARSPTGVTKTVAIARRHDSPTVEQPALGTVSGEYTAEIDLDDLGLDVKDLEGLPGDLGDLPMAAGNETDTREQKALRDDDGLLSATGVTKVLHEDDLTASSTSVMEDQDATMLATSFDEGTNTLTGTEVLEGRQINDDSGSTSLVRSLKTKDAVDLDLADLTAALHGADTVEQPRSQSFSRDVFGGGSTPLDLDIGNDPHVADDDPTGTEEVSPLDPQTMTEVGTKLDLARAYIDMGDPEGARSILEEVLDEGDSGQRREAQGLIDVLSA